MKRKVSLSIIVVAAIALFTGFAAAFTWVTNHKKLPQPNVPKPAVRVPFSDPVFGTNIMRLTNARAGKVPGIIPTYAKRQAWNADETRMMLQTGDGLMMLFNGSTYRFVKVMEGVQGDDVFWHPKKPNMIYYVPYNNTLYSYNIASAAKTRIYTFKGFDWADTSGEGNLSRDGRYYAVACRVYDYQKQETRYKNLAVLDIPARKVISKLTLPTNLEDFDWVSISPTGKYVVVNYADTTAGRFHGVEVYTRNFKFLWQKPLGYGHSDLGIDDNGEEVLVMGGYDESANVTYINSYRLRDGHTTRLLTTAWWFYNHISCRNLDSPGWCFVSTYDGEGRLTDSPATWAPFEDEVFALRLDGSRRVRRIAHHHSRRFSPATPDSDNSVYWAEPHATVSRYGTRVLFGSNWRQKIADPKSCDTYVVNLRGKW